MRMGESRQLHTYALLTLLAQRRSSIRIGIIGKRGTLHHFVSFFHTHFELHIAPHSAFSYNPHTHNLYHAKQGCE